MIHMQINVSRPHFNMGITAVNDGVIVEESQGLGLGLEGIFFCNAVSTPSFSAIDACVNTFKWRD
jgi:hypothetical protein